VEAVTLELPYPPSVNHYWLAAGGGARRLSDAGRTFRDMVAVQVMLAGRPKFEGDLKVSVRLYAADRRRRDIDNGIKSILDSLQHAGVYADDECVVALMVRKTRFPNDAPGSCTVSIATA
jgi:crossover junction endodeoxyribonuclease RusA